MTVVSIHKMDENFNDQWFFSTDHCQPNLDSEWIPITYYNTSYEEIREYNNRSSIVGAKNVEIENPNPLYKPKELC